MVSETLVVTIVLGCVLMSQNVDAGVKSDLLCKVYKDTFIILGCVDKDTNAVCKGIKVLMTHKSILTGFKPVCDFYPCTGYGQKTKKDCIPASGCARSDSNGICNIGEVCCKKCRRRRRINAIGEAAGEGEDKYYYYDDDEQMVVDDDGVDAALAGAEEDTA